MQARIRELRQVIDGDWLAALDRTAIENCQHFTYSCPLRWESLQPTDQVRIRFCATCDRTVHHCNTLEEARDKARQGHCVAVDSQLCRTKGDLTPDDAFAEGEMTMGEFDPSELPAEQPPRRHWWQFWRRSP